MTSTVDRVEAYEAGYLDARQTLELFAELIRTERVWNLDPPYPRTALQLVAAGYITLEGKITNTGRTLMAKILDEGREGSPCDVNLVIPEIVEASD